MENITNTVLVTYNDTHGYMNLFDETQVRKSYHSLQFHFHSPSEHTFDGKNYDLEMHIVHSNADGSALSVIGVVFDQRAGGIADNDFLATLISCKDCNSTTNKTMWTPTAADAEALLGRLDKTKLFNYEGSLTTPPCTEIVEWNVINDPQPISTSQLQFFQRKWSGNQTYAKGRGNNRQPQPINTRTIYYYGGASESSALHSLFLSVIAALSIAIAYVI